MILPPEGDWPFWRRLMRARYVMDHARRTGDMRRVNEYLLPVRGVVNRPRGYRGSRRVP